jgi:hypothetical protein
MREAFGFGEVIESPRKKLWRDVQEMSQRFLFADITKRTQQNLLHW